MNLFSKIQERIDKIFDSFEKNLELKKWNRTIKKACKKYNIKNKNLFYMYKNIQDQILSEINNKPKDGQVDFRHSHFNSIMKQRIYDLNREFIFLVSKGFHNSLYAITRQIIELYIRILQCRGDKNMIDKILNEERQKGSTKDLINKLKKNIKIPYVKRIDSNAFLDSVLKTFYDFSSLFHISGISLSQNVWIWNENENSTRFYIKNPQIKDGERLLVFTKRSVIPNETYFSIIHQFYSFSGLCLTELELLEEKNEQ